MAGKSFLSLFVKVEDPDPSEATGMPGNLPHSESIAGYGSALQSDEPTVAPAGPKPIARTAMDWTLAEVLEAGGAATDRNSAETVIKMRDKLASFPQDQQLGMIRAMDASDDTWDEATVVLDAQKRVAILDKYVGLVQADQTKQVAQIDAAFQATKLANEGQINDLDAQIAALQGQRAQVVTATQVAEAAAKDKSQAVKSRADGVLQTVADATARFKTLLTFFGK